MNKLDKDAIRARGRAMQANVFPAAGACSTEPLDSAPETALMALNRNDNALDRLNSALIDLAAVIEPVLRPSVPDCTGAAIGTTLSAVPLIGNVEAATARVHDMASRVENLNARIAL